MANLHRVPRPILLHLAPAADWARYERQGTITPPSLGGEGFVHLSTVEQAPFSAARYYADRTDLVALALDPAGLRLGALRWAESHPGQFFPHHHEPVSTAAVIDAVPWPAPSPGAPLLPGDPPGWPLPDALPLPPGTAPLPPGATVRRLRAADATAVHEVVTAAVGERPGEPAGQPAARAVERLHTAGGWGLGIEIDGQLVSLVLGVPMRADDGAGPIVAGWCHVGSVMTRPAWWGRGLATRLMVEGVAVMRSLGASHAELWTQVDNPRALALYARLDWQRTDRPPMPFDDELLLHHTLALRP